MISAIDSRQIQSLSKGQAGVFSTADLRTALAETHSAAFKRRVQQLLKLQVLRRFSRGFYVAQPFDLGVLSQRIAPQSCISFETVLARALVIGPSPGRSLVATKVGRTRSYRCDGYSIEHVGLSSRLAFGIQVVQGVRYADAEKAMLDTLYFHMRGRSFAFDLFSDVNLTRLNKPRLRSYLRNYLNPKFVSFAAGVLELS
jgi:hypothetical protein